MAESIQTITDKGQFEEIFNKNFAGNEIFLKTKSGDLLIQFLGYSDGNAAFRIPRVKSVPDTILIFSRTSSNTIYSSLKLIENKEDTFIFIPVKFQIISESMKEDRKEIGGQGGKNIIYVSNIISQSMIHNLLDSSEKKIALVKQKINTDLKGKFERIRIVFVNETSIDVRMKHFLANFTPIMIRYLSMKPEEKELAGHNFYINTIYAKDYKLTSQKEFISEVAVPIVYRNMVPYGYIQVNNTKPMNENHLTVIKRLAAMINEYFMKENLFVVATDKFIVNDISKNGLGIVFKDRRQARYFQKESTVILEMSLPNGNKVSLIAVIRNVIFLESGIIKVGMEIKNIDPISEVNYDEYLEEIKK